MGERGLPVRGQEEREGRTGDLTGTVSGRGTGWEQMGERTGDLRGETTVAAEGEGTGSGVADRTGG